MNTYTKKLVSIILSSMLVATLVTVGRMHGHLTSFTGLLVCIVAGLVLGFAHAFIFDESTDEQ